MSTSSLSELGQSLGKVQCGASQKLFFLLLTLLLCGSESKESACNSGDLGSIPGLGRSPGGENGNPLQCSGLENPMNRGARWTIIHGVTKSRTDWACTHSYEAWPSRLVVTYSYYSSGSQLGLHFAFARCSREQLAMSGDCFGATTGGLFLASSEQSPGMLLAHLMLPRTAKRALPPCWPCHSGETRSYRSGTVFSSAQSLSRVRLFVTPWTAARQASLSITISQSLLKLMCIELVMPPNHLILCCPLLLLPSIFPSIRVFSRHFLS